MIAISAPDGALVYVNRAGRALLGLAPGASLTGVNTQRAYSPERWTFMQEVARPRAVETGSWADESFLLARDGRKIPVLQVLIALKNDGGEVEFFAGISRDITKLKQSEEKLALQLEELRRWYQATLGREDRVRQLKREVNELRERLGEAPRYLKPESDADSGDVTRAS